MLEENGIYRVHAVLDYLRSAACEAAGGPEVRRSLTNAAEYLKSPPRYASAPNNRALLSIQQVRAVTATTECSIGGGRCVENLAESSKQL